MPDQISGRLSPWLRRHRVEAVRPLLRGRVLDFGCGTGQLAELVELDEYTGVDIDRESLEIARRRFPDGRFFESLAEASGPFDTIAGLAVIEHVPRPAQLLAELRELLSPGGRIVLTTPHPLFDWAHRAGAAVGLFSRHAADEHEELIDRRRMEQLATEANLLLISARHFLYGVNQLFVLHAR